VSDRAAWETLRYHADYLNPEENEELGVLDLVTKSIQTTRRFDGLKLFVTMQTLGREGFAQLIDQQLELAQQAAAHIEAQPDLMLVAEPNLVSVVFRYIDPALPAAMQDRINAAARRALLLSGQGTIGMTRVDGRYCVKFTLMNPQTGISHLEQILKLFTNEARRQAKALNEGDARQHAHNGEEEAT
jgi:L-2,4-diaminobutyrate decarboxylase